MRETKNLEFKEAVSATFLKTVSAYANYGTGEILFGVADDGTIVGVSSPETVCLDIENRINDNLEPVPEYTLSVHKKTSIITLTVHEGQHKPYFYKSKAYRRSDSSTVEVDRLELTRLILEGQNSSFEELPANKQELTFQSLGERLSRILRLESVTTDTLKTLELYSDDNGYNNAAELLSDTNGFPGINIVRFGENISYLMDRENYENESVLLQYDHAVGMYRKYYQYEKVDGSLREIKSMIPEEAYREAIANALVHRTWDINAQINVGMFPDRIEITSPGGLPKGISKEEYLRGGLSILRNRIIGNIFFRLQMIEKFGTGIRRINEAYEHCAVKPIYDIQENSIRIVLPILRPENGLTEDEERVYSLLRGRCLSISTIAEAAGFGKSKTADILKRLIAAGLAYSTGNGRGTKYSETV